MEALLVKAEGIFHQIKEAQHLTDSVRSIVGLPLVGKESTTEESVNINPDSPDVDPYEQVYDTMQHITT